MQVISESKLIKVDPSLVAKVEASRTIVGMLSILTEQKTNIKNDSPEAMLFELKSELLVLFDESNIRETTDYIYTQLEEEHEIYLLLYNALIGYKNESNRYVMSKFNRPEPEHSVPDLLRLAVASMVASYLQDNAEGVLDGAMQQVNGKSEMLFVKRGDESPSVTMARVIYVLMYSRLARLYEGKKPSYMKEEIFIDDFIKAKFDDFINGKPTSSPEALGLVTCQFEDGVFMIIKPIFWVSKGKDVGSRVKTRVLNATFYTNVSKEVVICSYSIKGGIAGEHSAEQNLSNQDKFYSVVIK